MTEVPEIVRAVTNLLQSSRYQTLYGAALGGLLRLRFPGFHPRQFGARNLREFIEAHVPDVTVRRSEHGADVVYALGGSTSPERVPAAPPEADVAQTEHDLATETVWKAFVSPNSPFKLFVDPSRRSVRLIPLHQESLSDPWRQLPPLSPDIHFRIARDFADSLPAGEAREALERSLAQPMWWRPFFALARSFGLGDQWTGFRKTALEGHFREALRRMGVAGAESAVLTPPPTTRRRPSGVSTAAPPTPRVSQEGPGTKTDLRRLAMAIVGQLSDSELRELRFRLGDLVTALRSDE